MTDELEAKARAILSEEWDVPNGEFSPRDIRAVVRAMRWAAEECAALASKLEIQGEGRYAALAIRARFAAKEQNKSEQAPLPAPAGGATAETMGQHAGGVPRLSFQPEPGNSPRDWVCSSCYELYSENSTSGAWRGTWRRPNFDEPLFLEHACLTRPLPQCGHMAAIPISSDVAYIIKALRKPAEGLAGSRGAEAPAAIPIELKRRSEEARIAYLQGHAAGWSAGLRNALTEAQETRCKIYATGRADFDRGARDACSYIEACIEHDIAGAERVEAERAKAQPEPDTANVPGPTSSTRPAPAVSPLDRAEMIERAHQFWRESRGYSFSMMADFALSVMPKPMSEADVLEKAAEIIETQPGHGESQALLRMWAAKLRADDAAELAEIARMNEPCARPEPQWVTCTTCGRRKKPIGRDSMDNGLCDSDCQGYHEEPWPSAYWPGEQPAPEPDVFERVADELWTLATPGIAWWKQAAALLRERFGGLLEIVTSVRSLQYDRCGSHAIAPVALTVKAQSELARLSARAGKETGK